MRQAEADASSWSPASLPKITMPSARSWSRAPLLPRTRFM
jgi:hypothetical protein